MTETSRRGTGRRALLGGAAAGAAALAMPAISYGQADVVRIGHLTPRTGFLGPLGEYAVQAATLAAEEINAAGGILGRRLELIVEDSVNPQTGSAKAERLAQRERVAAILGEINSATALAIAQVVNRERILFINTGANSDALRGSDCQRFMFHIEAQNSMYVKAVGRSLVRDGLVRGKRWYSLTADYAFGQDLLRVAQRMIERDNVAFLMGEINSASALTISQVAARNKKLFLSIGARSDALRGKDCNRYTFHVDIPVTVMVNAAGQALVREGLVKGKKIYSLTADYLFGHDLSRQAKRFFAANGGQQIGDELVATDVTDFSPYLLKIRQARPDLVISNLAGNQVTNFLKQYSEYGLSFPVAGFGFDTALAWGAGPGNFGGTWPVVWHHLIDTPGSKKFVADFTRRWNRPPENQAWGDYTALKITARSMNELRSTEGPKLVEHFESGAKFDLLKTREGYFRQRDHQMMMEMYAITALPADRIRNRWDVFTSSPPVPGPDESLEAIAATAEENACVFRA